ncbi:dihydroorotate dehydrogenase [Candidatus Heimdallarchaeota archaeon B3_Heim]|nr:MAG: dihydroorotate dehydrogenase [Candidatus Heimdallarchaeota archaeon B3_Heim]
MIFLPGLNVNFAGVEFENPFLLSSAPPTKDGTQIKRAIELGWGGAVTKSLLLVPDKNTRPRLGFLKLGKRMIGMSNIEMATELSLERWKKEIVIAKTPGAPIIGSIMTDSDPENWVKLTKIVEETGVDMLELNVSCPHMSPEKHMGALIGQDSALITLITKNVKENCSIPVIVKLTPNVTSIPDMTIAAKTGGADAISAINTVLSLIGVDIETGIPNPSSQGKSTFGGYSGPGVRPIALRVVAEIAQTTNLPISGIGGVDSWKSAIEFIMVGATTVQVCTAIMWRGYKIVENWKKGLQSFMERKGYRSLNEFTGKSLQFLHPFSDFKTEPPIKARVTHADSCNGCGICVTSCGDGAYNAITLEDSDVAIDDQICDGCGLCVNVCPQNVMTMG